jgi:nucleotide-binding universal stress UspA family protein
LPNKFQEKLPPYTGYIDAQVPGGLGSYVSRLLTTTETCRPARAAAPQEGVILTTELVEGDEMQSIVECVQRNQSDLLVLGLHRHSLLFGRLWNHTTHDLSQQLTSSILAFD